MTELGIPAANRRNRGYLDYTRPVWPIFAIFLVFILARYMQWGARQDILATIRIEFLAGAAVSVVSAIQLTTLRGMDRNAKWLFGAIAALLLVIAIQVPFAANRPLAMIVFNDRVIKFAMVAFLIAVQVRSPDSMRWFVGAFLLSMFWITQESVRGLISGGLVWQNQGIMRLHGAVPIYMHPNSLGGVSVSVIPFCVFLFMPVRSWWLRLGLLALAATATICVIYSGSRTAYVGYLAFIVGWFVVSPHKKRWFTAGIVVGVIALLVMPEQYKERFLSIGGEEAEGSSKAARLQIIEDAVQVFARYPGGVGVASFPTVRRHMFGRIQDTHNLYLEVATNLGIQGLIVFLAFVTYVGWSLRKARDEFSGALRRLRALRPRAPTTALRRMVDGEIRDATVLHGCAQATFFFLIVRLTVGMFGMDLYEIYWWFAVGMAISLHEIAAVLVRRQKRLEEQIATATGGESSWDQSRTREQPDAKPWNGMK